MPALSHIRRHPVKGLGEEDIPRVALDAGAPLPFDRHWAVAHSKCGFEEWNPSWRHCRELLRVALIPELALARVAYDEASSLLTLSHPDLGEVAADPAKAPEAILDWVRPLADRYVEGPYRLISAAPQAMTDFEHTHVSIASESSLRALSDMAGAHLHFRRFRMNLWVEGAAPWEEFDWVGREIRVGAARLKVIERDKRCAATHANPDTGRRDLEITRLLHQRFGHMDFGLYAQVVEGGEVAVGDEVALVDP